MFIDEKTLNMQDAEEFVIFLEDERDRHEMELRRYKNIAESDKTDTFMRIVAMTVVLRHMDDIEHTNKTIRYLKQKFGWK